MQGRQKFIFSRTFSCDLLVVRGTFFWTPSCPTIIQAFKISQTWLLVESMFPFLLSCLVQRCCPWCWKSSETTVEHFYVHSMHLHLHTLWVSEKWKRLINTGTTTCQNSILTKICMVSNGISWQLFYPWIEVIFMFYGSCSYIVTENAILEYVFLL